MPALDEGNKRDILIYNLVYNVACEGAYRYGGYRYAPLCCALAERMDGTVCKLIAVATDKEGNPCDLNNPCNVQLYENTLQGWQMCREYLYAPNLNDAPPTLRDKVKELVAKLGECRVIAAKAATGIAYHSFDRAGFSVFEIASLSREVLDGIAQDVQAARLEEKPPEQVLAAPWQSGEDGVYEFDLVALQRVHPEVSSKKALMSFFDTTPFVALTLFCTHLPPWIEQRSDLAVSAREQNGVMCAMITKTCNARSKG